MNKTIIININGTVFHIEEDAYDVLKNYMTDVKRHFMDSADSLEITTDIENRIAEMFTELLDRESKQVIVEQDVQNVIAQMGTVEDFASAEEGEAAASASQPDTAHSSSRRLFRDPDNHLIAGVCSGIANYFDISRIWLRLAFVVAFCLFGTGVFLYIILWIVVPKAVSRADKMAMKGEPLDLQGFKRNFEYELKNVQGSVSALHDDARPFIYKSRDFIGDFFDHLRVFLNSTGRVLAKAFGLIIMVTCIGLAIALIVSVFAFFAYGTNNLHNLFPFSIINNEYTVPFVIACFAVLVLPLIGLFFLVTRLAFNRVVVSRNSGYAMLIVWIMALGTVIYYSIAVASEFRSGGSLSQTVNIKPSSNNTYYLQLNDARQLTAEDSSRLELDKSFAGKVIVDDEDNYDNDPEDKLPNSMSITVERSEVAYPVLVETFRARGKNYTNALMNARNIVYQYKQTDSVLTFDRHIQQLQRKNYRGQHVRLILKLPLNSKAIIDREMDRYIYNVDLYACHKEGDDKEPVFVMTETGLTCLADTTKAKADSLKKQ